MKIRAAGLVIALSLTACGLAQYEDASSKEQNHALIGQEYVTTQRLIAHGVTMDPNYKQVIDIFVLTPDPGFAGPEVVTTRYLLEGSKVRVKRIEECTTWWCFRVRLVLEVVADPDYAGFPVTIRPFGGPDVFSVEGSRRFITTPLLARAPR